MIFFGGTRKQFFDGKNVFLSLKKYRWSKQLINEIVGSSTLADVKAKRIWKMMTKNKYLFIIFVLQFKFHDQISHKPMDSIIIILIIIAHVERVAKFAIGFGKITSFRDFSNYRGGDTNKFNWIIFNNW